MKITKIYPRDIIAVIVLIACFILMAFGINSIVSGIIVMVVTFYFARRLDGEGEPDKDINQKVKKLEETSNNLETTTTKLKSYLPKPIIPGEVVVKPPILS